MSGPAYASLEDPRPGPVCVHCADPITWDDDEAAWVNAYGEPRCYPWDIASLRHAPV